MTWDLITILVKTRPIADVRANLITSCVIRRGNLLRPVCVCVRMGPTATVVMLQWVFLHIYTREGLGSTPNEQYLDQTLSNFPQYVDGALRLGMSGGVLKVHQCLGIHHL